MDVCELDLSPFFPRELEITNVEHLAQGITVHVKSKKQECSCPRCGQVLTVRRGRRHRTVQDLPIFGESVLLDMDVCDYRCDNPECGVCSVSERFDGFLESHGRMTVRCKAFITTLALETSCEGASHILAELGIHVSGDTIIRLLLKEYRQLVIPECSDTIGVDEFATKKRQTYQTIVVDEKTHHPVAVLDGRDGQSFREWLQDHKHVRTVTRDRASAYAKALSEEIPDAIQVADRFHLYDNLMKAVKEALGRSLPDRIVIQPLTLEPDHSEPGSGLLSEELKASTLELKPSAVLKEEGREGGAYKIMRRFYPQALLTAKNINWFWQ